MRQLPDTISARLSLHATGSDEELSIIVPGDPVQYRQLWSVFFSYDEKPYPKGGFEVRIPGPPHVSLLRLDWTQSGMKTELLGPEGPIFDKGTDLEFVLHGKSASKQLAITIK